MIKIVLDANVFVSAILTTTGHPARILDLTREEKIGLLTSLPIIEEVNKVLLYPRLQKLHKFTTQEINEKLNKLGRFAYFTAGKLKLNIIQTDPTDNKYLECGVEGNADFIVSGDRHLKDLKTFQGIKIVSPAEFIEFLMRTNYL